LKTLYKILWYDVLILRYCSLIFITTINNQNPVMADQKNNPNQLNIDLPEDVAEGIYSNLAIISHSPSEFVVDFIRIMPNIPKAKVKSRIVLTPQHAKKLLRALNENIEKFEAAHGVITEGGPSGYPFMNFNTPKAEA
jgi:Protein of unknown function (DUF3467)